MLNISNQNIKSLVIKNQELLNLLLSITGLEKKWQKENFLEIEIQKCFIRGELRYSTVGINLANLISNTIKLNKKMNSFNYFTRIYPMIHLSEDMSEESKIHFDQSDNNDLMTCWLTITENEYSPISILKLQNKYFKKIFSKIHFPNLLMKPIEPKIGELNFWDGHFLHKGNYNYSKKISCAYQMKFSKNKYNYEFSIEKKNEFESESLNEKENFSINYDKLKKLTIKLNQINLKSDNKELLLKTFNILKEIFQNKNMPISFALSVLAQRIFVNGKKFNISDYLNKSLLYDICSILLGCENLISYDRMCKLSKKNQFNFIENLNKYDFLKSIPTESYELREIIKKNNL